MTIGEQIRYVRKHIGLTQKELGNLSGTSETTIKQYELGKRQPRIEQLQKIAYALGGTISEIFILDDDEVPFQPLEDDSLNKQQLKPAPELTERDKRDIAKDLDTIMRKLTSGEEGPASYDGEPLSPEAAELFRDELEIALKRLKLMNKEKYTPKKYKDNSDN